MLLLAACGGDGDDDESSTSSTLETESSTMPVNTTIAPIDTTTTAAPVTPTSVAYVTEGASVMVANASRVDGAAGRMTDRLAAVGFTTVPAGNYSLGTIEVTQILHDPANPQALAVAQSLQQAFGGGDIQVVEMGSPPPVEGGDIQGAGVVVAMGNDIADKTLDELQGITTTTGAPTDSTSESTTANSTESTTA